MYISVLSRKAYFDYRIGCFTKKFVYLDISNNHSEHLSKGIFEVIHVKYIRYNTKFDGYSNK